MATVILPKGKRVYGKAATGRQWVVSYLTSSVGNKFTVAVTGLLLVGFLVGHMVGNLKMFSGPESINKYAYFLKHDLGVLIWAARAGLLVLFVTHLGINIQLKLRANAARPVKYAWRTRVAQATISSRTMLLTGLVILAFTIFHLAHFTFGVVHGAVLADGSAVNYHDLRDAAGRHDVYSMVIAGFRTWWISALYIAAQLILLVHLNHGIQSSVQTLGLVGRRFHPFAKLAGMGLAGLIVGGNLLIVVAVWTGYIPPVQTAPDTPPAVTTTSVGGP